ncbi:MAG TPA: type I-C CRISPR-associated endonuclease Cas1c [Thermomicrobiales bacterium]|nr:type I-C CRISPR-associated endonuclease Cas1c [Thermomicrobiales bacterium]
MQPIFNTLYVLTQGAYLHLDHDTVRVEVERATQVRVPLLAIGGLVTFGNVLLSPQLLARCAEDGRAVTILDRNGRFKARVVGPTGGNVLLRRAQHAALSDPARTLAVARHVVAGKLQNERQVLLRGAREAVEEEDREALGAAARTIAAGIAAAQWAGDLDALRGVEGAAAREYFGVFDRLVRDDRATFRMAGRNRRPPLDPINALLSFCYTLLLSDCTAALEGCGLDPQVGFLHALRPGRPALGLDLLEELRAPVADRLALTLINRRQLTAGDFEQRPGGAVSLTDAGRKRVVLAYQERKADEVPHRLLDRKLALGLVPHVQARLLARHLRGDLDYYPPFLIR